MGNSGRFAASLLFFLSATAQAASGTVVLIEGNVFSQKGDIYFTRPNVGKTVVVNQFGQYRDTPPPPAFVKWIQNTRRHLKPGDAVEEGEIIQTMGDGFVKILFNDDSVIDLGPAGVVQIQKFSAAENSRVAFFKLLYGKVRTVVPKPLKGIEKYQLATPAMLLGVRGTEFIVRAFAGRDNRTHSEVLCIHGQVSVDVAKLNAKGIVYGQPFVITPGMYFSTEGYHGLGQETQARKLSQTDLRTMVTKMSPQVNMYATAAGSHPLPYWLPGTGYKPLEYADHEPLRKLPTQNLNNIFNGTIPPAMAISTYRGGFAAGKGSRGIASSNDPNFEPVLDFEEDRAAFGSKKRVNHSSPLNR